MILSAYQAEPILDALQKGNKEIEVSLDLGLTKTNVKLGEEMLLPGQKISREQLEKVVKKDTMCFLIKDSQVLRIAYFSDGNFYKLMPTGIDTPPTIEISGIRMHVTKKFSPLKDTEEKIKYAKARGRVLDTCTGLGYTAIMAAKQSDEVITIERDENVVRLQELNPWSRELFTDDKIKRMIGDSFEEIKKFEEGYFDSIIHDPPRLSLSTLLYSGKFYRELFRVLRPGGRLYHYTGDPGSKKGLDIRKGVRKRLLNAGFRDVERVFNGITADRP